MRVMNNPQPQFSVFFPKLFSILLFIIGVMTGVLFFVAQFYVAAVLMACTLPFCIMRFISISKEPPDIDKYEINSLGIYFCATLAFFSAGQILTGFLCSIVTLLKLLSIKTVS